MNGNFAADLQAVFAAHGSRPALRMADGAVWTYSDLAERTARLATVLVEAGVAPGDRVLAQVGKLPETVALYLATLQAGGVYVPLNTAYTAAEVAYFVADAQPRLFVRDADRTGPADEHGGAAVLTLGSGGGSLVQAMDAAEPRPDVAKRDGDALAALVYTSGTTAAPRAQC